MSIDCTSKQSDVTMSDRENNISTIRTPKLLLFVWNSKKSQELQSIATAVGFSVTCCATKREAVAEFSSLSIDIGVLVVALGREGQSEESCWPILKCCHSINHQKIFRVVFSRTASSCPKTKLDCFDAGANMVTNDAADFHAVLSLVKSQGTATFDDLRLYSCPTCNLAGLTKEMLWAHYSLYHTAQLEYRNVTCPICKITPQNFHSHIHKCHVPQQHKELPHPDFAAFAWVVCQRESDGKFIMVNEPARNCYGRAGYWLPAGRVEAGETLVHAAEREALEEAGVQVKIVSVLRFMLEGGQVPRIVFFARPISGEALCKTIPDYESVGAMWVDYNALGNLQKKDFRSMDPVIYYKGVATGKIKKHCIETESFRLLEESVRELSLKDTLMHEDFAKFTQTWKQLEEHYPKDAFIKH